MNRRPTKCPHCESPDILKNMGVWECSECKTRFHADGKLTKRRTIRSTSYHDFVNRAVHGSIKTFRDSHPEWMDSTGVGSLAKRMTQQLANRQSRLTALALLLFDGKTAKLEELERVKKLLDGMTGQDVLAVLEGAARPQEA